MITEQNINEWAERYLQHTLSSKEAAELRAALEADPVLMLQWRQSLEILQALESAGERVHIRAVIRDAALNAENIPTEDAPARILPWRKYLRFTAAAAGLILCSSLATLFLVDKKENKADQRQYTELVRKIRTMEASQSKIMDSLNKDKENGTEIPVEEPALYGGTGFAIANDGYIATNYHVVKEANDIYVLTRKGEQLKAYIVARDPAADIAILKLEDKDYRFGKTALPYTIARPVSALGQRVFTIGYPKDDVVYNEGYISCESGFEGDRQSYQLEMTANPGQSGSPVLDKYGSIVALITGKQSNTTGTTYAVHSQALLELVHSLPGSAAIKLPEQNKLTRLDRTEQVNRMRDYVFSIRVNQ